MGRKNISHNRHRIALLGFTGSNLAMLEYCLSSESDCELVSEDKSSILIINGDQVQQNSDDLQEKINQKYPYIGKILISVQDLDWDGFSLLKKPHTVQQLLDMVRTFSIDNVDKEKVNTLGHKINPVKPKIKKDVSKEDIESYKQSRYSRKLQEQENKHGLSVKASDRLVEHLQAELEEARNKKNKLKTVEKSESSETEITSQKNAKAQREFIKQKQAIDEEVKVLKRQLRARKIEEKHTSEKERLAEIENIRRQQKEAELSGILTEEQVLQRCGNSSDVDFSRLDDRRRAFFNPEGTLLEKMLAACMQASESKQPIEILGLPGQLYIFPEENLFYSTFNNDFLNQLALTHFSIGELTLEPRINVELKSKDKHLSEEVEPMIWKVAVWTARGRLIKGIDPEKNFQLKFRPDFERFIFLPKCREISEIWVEYELSVLDVARILELPQRVVFSFMSGAFLLGWFRE